MASDIFGIFIKIVVYAFLADVILMVMLIGLKIMGLFIERMAKNG